MTINLPSYFESISMSKIRPSIRRTIVSTSALERKIQKKSHQIKMLKSHVQFERNAPDQDFVNINSLSIKLKESLQLKGSGSREISGTSTGFTGLDIATDGLQAGELIALAGRPGLGKTALAINIAEHVALNEGLRVAVFSMTARGINFAERMLSSIGRIPLEVLQTGKLADEEWLRLDDAIEKLKSGLIHVDESAGLTIGELRSRSYQLSQSAGPLGLIVVDYLQLMRGSYSSQFNNPANAFVEICQGLQMLARELKCPILVLIRLNNKLESRKDKRPESFDLLDTCNDVLKFVDVELLLYRDEYYYKEESEKPGTAEIGIRTQRHRYAQDAVLAYKEDIPRFENIALLD